MMQMESEYKINERKYEEEIAQLQIDFNYMEEDYKL